MSFYRYSEPEKRILLTGTTTVGIKCVDGVVLATDRRVTSGYFIAHKHAKKIWKIDDHVAATMSGAVADVQKILDRLTTQANYYKLTTRRPISVRALASLASLLLFNARPYIYLAHIILAGVDDEGPQIYTVDWFGTVTEERDYIATGSGSPTALGVLEDRYYPGITVKEAIEVAIRAVYSAMRRDPGSGEGIDVAYITREEGYRELTDEEVRKYLERSRRVES